MDVNTLRDLFEEHIQDLYSAEEQILDTLPDMIEAASDTSLRTALENHLEQTRRQRTRLEQIAGNLDFKPKGDTCKGMKGIIAEGDKLVKRDTTDADVRDAAIIAAAQRVEHYEIAGYGTARTYAQMLGENEAVGLLEQTLNEEKEADVRLTGIAEGHVNRRAMKGD